MPDGAVIQGDPGVVGATVACNANLPDCSPAKRTAMDQMRICQRSLIDGETRLG